VRTYEDLGTVAEVLDQADDSVRPIVEALHEVVVALDPDVHVVPRTGEKSIAYGLGPKKMSEAYCYLMPQAKHANLGFYHGVDVADPDGMLEGTGKRLRHVKVRSIAMAASEQIRALILAARGERQAALGA
jgi:hypothetical protein